MLHRTLVLMLLVPSVALGQLGAVKFGRSVAGSFGWLTTDDQGSGVSMTLSYAATTQRFTINLTPVDVGFMQASDDSRYQEETFDNGNTVCRDTETGQFASRSLCGGEMVYAASVEGLFGFKTDEKHWAAVGAGFRVGNSAGPYGTVAFHFAAPSETNWNLRLRLGASFSDVAAGAAIPF